MINYFTYEEVLQIYRKTIEKSGGGFAGVRDAGGIQSILSFVQHDDYYPSFTEKLGYIIFRFCKGHFFFDGNKRIALTLGCNFLFINGYYRAARVFMKRMEFIVYHIAAGNISYDLLLRLLPHIIDSTEFSESIKLELLDAIARGASEGHGRQEQS